MLYLSDFVPFSALYCYKIIRRVFFNKFDCPPDILIFYLNIQYSEGLRTDGKEVCVIIAEGACIIVRNAGPDTEH